MNLQTKVTIFFVTIAAILLAVLVAISLYAFRAFSITSATEHIRTAAEIVRVNLTESMINGTINRREGFLKRVTEVHGLKSARVVRGPLVQQQFGAGLIREAVADDLERQVLADGKPRFQVQETADDTLFRGTIPYIASAAGTPNCLQCHQVSEGAVLGAVSITMSLRHLKEKAFYTVGGIVSAVGLFGLLTLALMRRLIRPVSVTAHNVEVAVQRAIKGDFKAQVHQESNDEIGQIANDMNRLLGYLDDGLNRIGNNVVQLTNRPRLADENLLTSTIDAVEGLTKAARFKQAIEEDETKIEIYQRLAHTIEDEFAVREYSLYELVPNKNQMHPILVNGQATDSCHWCDPQILVRTESCRARRTGHVVDGVTSPGICYAFQPPATAADRTHICVPMIQSGAVGSVLQLVVRVDDKARLQGLLPYISVYLREASPVLEARRLMETLRDANLRDPMTGLNNRRFLEEYVDTLLASTQRRQSHLAILMLDLDYFKMVNDTYGHDAGDAVLKALARVLRQSVRASDLVIRYGGEEFLIILQDAERDSAEQIAENIRQSVEELKIAAGGATLQKTISIGISDFPTDSETFWQAIKFADVALYRAKETGRNRVVRFTPEMWTDKSEY